MNSVLGPPRYRLGTPIGLGVRSRSRYERTNERTNGEITHVSRTTHLPTRARMYGDDVDSRTDHKAAAIRDELTPTTPAAPRDEATPTEETA